jgi:hypothetical protein
MDTARTKLRTPRAARRIPRFLAALALAAALVATAAGRPGDAGAMRISERQLSQLCAGMGGSVEYDFWDPDFDLWEVTCTYWDEFGGYVTLTCWGGEGLHGPSDRVDCGYLH